MEKESIRSKHEEMGMAGDMKLEQQALNREGGLQLDTTDEVKIPSPEQ